MWRRYERCQFWSLTPLRLMKFAVWTMDCAMCLKHADVSIKPHVKKSGAGFDFRSSRVPPSDEDSKRTKHALAKRNHAGREARHTLHVDQQKIQRPTAACTLSLCGMDVTGRGTVVAMSILDRCVVGHVEAPGVEMQQVVQGGSSFRRGGNWRWLRDDCMAASSGRGSKTGRDWSNF